MNRGTAYFIQSSVAYRDLDHLGPDNRQDVVALRDKTQAFVRRLLSEAADEGVVCTLADLDLASIAMFTTVNAVHIWYTRTVRWTTTRPLGVSLISSWPGCCAAAQGRGLPTAQPTACPERQSNRT